MSACFGQKMVVGGWFLARKSNFSAGLSFLMVGRRSGVEGSIPARHRIDARYRNQVRAKACGWPRLLRRDRRAQHANSRRKQGVLDLKRYGRFALPTAVLVAAALVMPGAVAFQDPSGYDTNPCPKVSPSPTPTESPTPEGTPTPEPSPSPSASPSPTPPDDCLELPEPNPGPKPDKGDDKKNDDKKDKDKGKKDKKHNKNKDKKSTNKKGKGKGKDRPDYFEATDSYDTSVLIAVAANLRALGWSNDRIISKVFSPFIIAGKANWIDTWGAPRFGPGLLVRTHEGQDVFCEYGAPVLAVEEGKIEYDEGSLGGIVARLWRKNGSYWYYAHLSKVNDRDFPNGSKVEPGDVIGFCGNTGNAITTPPHVHFGFYTSSDVARDPMPRLIRWLRLAQRESTVLLAKVQGARVAQIDMFRSARLFGDSFSPGPSLVPRASARADSSGGLLAFARAAIMSTLEGPAESTTAAKSSSGLEDELGGITVPPGD
jgi:murein DD-endopeptidase MepM/ murein hydrolase activator NlpD